MGLTRAVAGWGQTGLTGSGWEIFLDMYVGNMLCIVSMLLLASNHKYLCEMSWGDLVCAEKSENMEEDFPLPALLKGISHALNHKSRNQGCEPFRKAKKL